jgi:hypothetical protein
MAGSTQPGMKTVRFGACEMRVGFVETYCFLQHTCGVFEGMARLSILGTRFGRSHRSFR